MFAHRLSLARATFARVSFVQAGFALAALALMLPVPAGHLTPVDLSARPEAVSLAMREAGYTALAQGRQFTAFDSQGDGRAIEVIGDLTTARRIVIFVPGSDTTLATFDSGLAGVTRRAPATQARAIFDAASQATRGVAVVAWLGYDPPEGFGLASITRDRAEDGAAELIRYVRTLPAHATVVIVGHSYGAVVAALAAPALAAPGPGPAVTDLVALAAPGLGASTITGLHPTARVWVATAPGDWINNIPKIRIGLLGHGPIPADATRLPTGGVHGHDGYLVPGSSTLDALATVIASG